MFCCALLCVHSCFAIILIGKRGLVTLLCLSFWCLVIAVWLFLKMLRVYLQFVIVVFSDQTHFFITHCIRETPRRVLLQTVKTQMKRGISSGSTLFVKVKRSSDIFLLNYNLTPLDMYTGLSQVYCIKSEESISIQRVNFNPKEGFPTLTTFLFRWCGDKRDHHRSASGTPF